MAVQFYVETLAGRYKSGVADETIKAGTIVSNDGAGVTLADAQEPLSDIDGLALFSEEYMAPEDEDEIVDEEYSSGDRVKYAPFNALVGHARTPTDNGQTAPSIDHETVVGLVDTSSGDAAASDFAGRLVEEGYNNGTTTFNRSNTNFVALGEAYRPGKQNDDTVTSFDTTFRVDFYETPRT